MCIFLYWYTSDTALTHAKGLELGKDVLNHSSLKANNLFILY